MMMVCQISVNTTENETSSTNDMALDEPNCRAVILTKVIMKMANDMGMEFTGKCMEYSLPFYVSQPQFHITLSSPNSRLNVSLPKFPFNQRMEAFLSVVKYSSMAMICGY